MRQPTMQDWAERLWPGQPGLQCRWIEAVRIVRATRNGWVLDRTPRRPSAKVIPLHTLTAVNTADLGAREFRSTIPASLDTGPDTIPTMPADACTEVGHIHYPPRSTASLWTRLRRWASVVYWRHYR